MTLSYSRALYLEFFFDQTMENFLRGHVHAFQAWDGQPRVILYDNLKQRRAGAPRQPDPFQPSADRAERSLSLRRHGPARCAPAIRKGAWNEPSAMCAIPSGPAAPSPRWPNAIARPCSGAIRWRTNGAGRATTAAPSREVFAEEQPASAASSAASFHHRPDRDRALAQDHLCSLRSQRLLHPAGSGRPAADPGGLRHLRAHSGWRRGDRPPSALLRPPPTGARSGSSGSRAEDQAQSFPRHARRPLGASRAGEQNASGPGLRARRIGRQPNRATDQTAGRSMAPPLCAAPSCEALERNTPRASSVAFLLRRQPSRDAALAVDLSHHPQAQSLDVRPHDLETYDELARTQDDDDSEQ